MIMSTVTTWVGLGGLWRGTGDPLPGCLDLYQFDTGCVNSHVWQDTPAGRRAAGASGPRSSQPKRRTFTAAYKLAMIEKYDAATEPGAKGALLRGEGLYDSHISYWRKARDSGALNSSAAAADAVPAVADKSRPGRRGGE